MYNYNIMSLKVYIGSAIIVIIIFLFIGCGCGEKFNNFVKKTSKKKVLVGMPTNTPSELQSIMKNLQSTAQQTVADSQYDTVADDYLDAENIQ